MITYSRWSNAWKAGTASAVLMLIAALTLLVVGCDAGGGGSTATTAPGGGPTTVVNGQIGGNEIQVVMSNRAFDPATITVNVGDTVTWLNQDAPQHDVVVDNGEFTSEPFDQGQTFSFTFTKAGTYTYHCSIHPGMTGTVTVQ
jgi:plastocyanin